jgi:threonine dehydrogenase-like Zn-dependent dehydrogenase
MKISVSVRSTLLKALVLESDYRLVYKEVPDPVIRSDEVLVRVKVCGICGSDVHGLDGSTGRRRPPLIMGHEASGVIEARGTRVKRWKRGERVTFDSTIYPLDDWYTVRGFYNLSDRRQVLGVSCGEYRRDGAFAEYVAVPQHILHKIPQGVSFEQAALTEPAAVALHAVNLTPLENTESVLVIGCGIIGILLIQILRSRGCRVLIATDPDRERLALATGSGADIGLDPTRENVENEVKTITEGRGADVAFDAAGVSSSFQTALSAVRRGAAVTLVGNLVSAVELPLQSVVTRQLRIQGSCAICGEFPSVLEMIRRKQLSTDPVLSAIAPLIEGPEWFERLVRREPGMMKVLLRP